MSGSIEFCDDDEGYLRWVDSNPNGFVLNLRRGTSSGYVVLHEASCKRISQSNNPDGAFTERGYRKICAGTIEALQAAAKKEGRPDGSFSKRCALCCRKAES